MGTYLPELLVKSEPGARCAPDQTPNRPSERIGSGTVRCTPTPYRMSQSARVHLLLPLRNQCLPATPKDAANPILGRQILWQIPGLDVTECDVLPRWGTQWERSGIAQGLAQIHALHCDKVRIWFRSQDHRTRRWLILQHDGKCEIVR